jgi:N-acetylmuramoyl-L-alanine amidase
MCGLLFFDLSLFLVREFFPGHYNDNINLLETDSDQKTASANFDLKLSIEPKLTKFSENDSILYINQGESDSSMVEEPLYNHAAQFAMDAQDTYEVRKGDTLWSISKNLNIPFKISLWAKYNPQLKNPNLIYPGDIIHVPCHENSHEDLLNNSYSHAADDTAADNYIEENIFAPLDELPEYLKQKILENEIILLAGHNYKHPGASCISHGGKRIYEHSLSVKTVMFMENLLKEKFGFKNITVVPFEKNLQQKAEFINSLITERNSSKVHILEVHYNASEDSRYNGTTMIYKNGSLQSKNLAEILNNEVASNCPLKKLPGMSEKITSHSRLYLMHATNIPVDNIVISETGYMSNDEDRSTIVNNIETIASSLCSGLAKNIYRNSVIHEETFAANETLQNTSHIAF